MYTSCTLHEKVEGVVGGIEQHTHHVPGLELAPVAAYARSVAGTPKAIENPALFDERFMLMAGAPKGMGAEQEALRLKETSLACGR